MNNSYPSRPVAVVTGATSGIGAATARRLAVDGFHVVVHGASQGEAADAVSAEIQKVAGCQSIVCLCDFLDQDQLPGFVDCCFDWQGRIDVWVNNAGVDVLTGSASREPFEEKLRRVLAVDVVATVLLSRMVGRRMVDQAPWPDQLIGGTIINMGWDQAAHGMAGDSGEMFAASKGAVMAVTRSLARSLAPAVRVNAVAPGWIQTAWGRSASQGWQARATQESLLGRWGQPEDVAAVIAFLAGPDSQFVNAQVIPVNGGFRHHTD